MAGGASNSKLPAGYDGSVRRSVTIQVPETASVDAVTAGEADQVPAAAVIAARSQLCQMPGSG